MTERKKKSQLEPYQQMSAIRGETEEYIKRAEYMTKAVDALRDSFKTAEQREAERHQAEKEGIEASRNNTQAIKELIQAIKEGRIARENFKIQQVTEDGMIISRLRKWTMEKLRVEIVLIYGKVGGEIIAELKKIRKKLK